ncbi:MAG: cytochrome c biogenesis protein CcsA [Hahellaceae bacterium]|nr:cytochrome c biogenesis protein CcsA [Hahellaceae bacterium]
MNIVFYSVAALGLYATGTLYQLGIYYQKIQARSFFIYLTGFLAVLAHTAATYGMVAGMDGPDLGFLKISSLIACLIVFILLLMTLRHPLRNLFLIAYPLAAATLVASLIFEIPAHQLQATGSGLLTHIILSVLAYAIFTLAAAQAFLLYLQNRQLKTNYTSRLLRNLPPLQTMERLLFEMIWAGWILLTLSIINGMIFIENIFAQHLVHKTLLSILAWAIFSTLLIGRQIAGWRGLTASRWTLWGCFVLMLGYYGSKLVLELVIKH